MGQRLHLNPPLESPCHRYSASTRSTGLARRLSHFLEMGAVGGWGKG